VPERWLDPGIEGLRAEVCQVRSTREETALLFGSREKAERCIVLRPALAKELAAALAAFLREYEAQLNATPAGRLSSRASESDVPAGALTMFQQVRALSASFGLERSFKLAPGGVRDDRVIFGLRRDQLDRDALLASCRTLGMPDAYLSQLDAALPEANTVGFGFEGGVYKVYLEFWNALRQRLAREPRNVTPATLFLGFKWPVSGGNGAIASYTCYPLLSVGAVAARLRALYDAPEASPSVLAALAILELAARRIGKDDSFVYVEAAEEGNPRKSFDLNLYKARLAVNELAAPLSALARSYGAAAPAELFSLARQLGHISGGRGRNGQDFLTVYYEIEGL
jgi:hypothetical protein